MDIARGGIYVLKEGWKPYDEAIINHRPIIVVRICKDIVEAVYMGVLFADSDNKKQLMVEYYVSGKKYMTSVSCDIIHKIPIEYIDSYVGQVDDSIIRLIKTKSGYYHENTLLKTTPYAINESEEKNKYKKANVITIIDHEKFITSLQNIQDDIKEVKQLAKESKNPLNIWKERIIGFLFGIIASVIASAIWENCNALWDWNIIEHLEEFLQR